MTQPPYFFSFLYLKYSLDVSKHSPLLITEDVSLKLVCFWEKGIFWQLKISLKSPKTLQRWDLVKIPSIESHGLCFLIPCLLQIWNEIKSSIFHFKHLYLMILKEMRQLTKEKDSNSISWLFDRGHEWQGSTDSWFLSDWVWQISNDT